jgi:hypothetical protein
VNAEKETVAEAVNGAKHILTKADILGADDLRKEEVAVEEWGPGAKVFVRTMTGAELNRYLNTYQAREGEVPSFENTWARLLVFCLCDEGGNRLFQDNEAAALGRKNSAALRRLFGVAERMNGQSAEDVEAARKN